MSCEHNFLGASTCERCGVDEHDHLLQAVGYWEGCASRKDFEILRLRACWHEVLELADMAADRVPVISRKLAEIVERATTSAQTDGSNPAKVSTSLQDRQPTCESVNQTCPECGRRKEKESGRA